MRMRRKKNLDSRINDLTDYLTLLKNDSLNFNDAVKEKHLIDFGELFCNSNPVCLEIGCGKGQFAITFAKLHPDKNILCVEKCTNVIVTAAEAAKSSGLKNIHFLCTAAEYLPSYLCENSICEIYLNFSCPFPKTKHIAHRLTNKRFLDIYKLVLADNGAIYQKTDNMKFFEYSIESFSQNGFRLSCISLDLHNSDFKGNIITEYEEKFSSQGMPIYRLEARL